MAASLDWLDAYQQARAGVFGDSSQSVLDRIASEEKDNPTYQKMVSDGSLTPQQMESFSNESDSGTRPAYTEDSLTPEARAALPKEGPAGYTPPAGYAWTTLSQNGSPGQVNSDGSSDSGEYKYTYNDPNYGLLGLASTKKAPDDPVLDYLRMGAIAAFAGPTAGALGSALGLGTSGTQVLGAGLKLGVNSMITGQAPNPFSALVSILRPSLPSFGSVVSTLGGGS